MSEFALIYRMGGETMSPEEKQAHLTNCMNWLNGLLESGVIKDVGIPLGSQGGAVVGRNGSVHDGPFAETKDIISGLTLVQANDLAEAIEIAKTCPVAHGGGTVEVRHVEGCS